MSKSAYQKIKEKGLLSRSCFDVYEILAQNGPMTAGEIFLELQYKAEQLDEDMAMPRNLAAARLSEMREMGVVKEKSLRTCEMSGRTCAEWTITGKLPQAPEARRTYWVVEAGKNRKIYLDQKAALAYQKKSGGSLIRVAERRQSASRAKLKK